MKFISKFGNLQVVLKPGLPDAPLAGRLAEPGIYARFEQGMLETNDQHKIDLLLKNPSFGTDFIVFDEDAHAPSFPAMEPEHDVVNVEYGHMGANINPRGVKLSPEMMKVVSELATKMATEAFAKMVADSKVSVSAPDAATEVTSEEVVPAEETTIPEAPKSPVQEKSTVKKTK